MRKKKMSIDEHFPIHVCEAKASTNRSRANTAVKLAINLICDSKRDAVNKTLANRKKYIKSLWFSTFYCRNSRNMSIWIFYLCDILKGTETKIVWLPLKNNMSKYVCVCVGYVYESAGFSETTRQHHIPRDLRYRQLWDAWYGHSEPNSGLLWDFFILTLSFYLILRRSLIKYATHLIKNQ